MINIGKIIATYFVPLSGLIILYCFVKMNPLFDKRQTRLFKIAIGINLFMIFMTSLDYICASNRFPFNWLIRRITSFTNFGFSPFIPLFLLLIYDHKKNIKKWLYIPALLNIIICFTSIFINIVFFITPFNQYLRGFIFFLPFSTSLFYMLLLIINPTKLSIKSKKNERYFLLTICLLLTLAMYLEIVEGYHFLDWSISGLGLILYYLLLSIHCNVIDSLTGAYNRFMYTQALSRIEHKQSCLFITIDINDFKSINDDYGHDVGDTYLINFTSFITKHLENYATVYRIGGDEFFVIAKKGDSTHIRNIMEQIVQEGIKQNFSFAYGISQYVPSEPLSAAIKNADMAMYYMKKNMKTLKSKNLADN